MQEQKAPMRAARDSSHRRAPSQSTYRWWVCSSRVHADEGGRRAELATCTMAHVSAPGSIMTHLSKGAEGRQGHESDPYTRPWRPRSPCI